MSFITLFNLCFVLFFVGLLGIIFNTKNLILILFSIELLLLCVNFCFVIVSCYLDDIVGQMFSLFILTLAASESAIGLAILISFFRLRGTLNPKIIYFLRG
jgi:NADH-quinone oxidoreductase subunit K